MTLNLRPVVVLQPEVRDAIFGMLEEWTEEDINDWGVPELAEGVRDTRTYGRVGHTQMSDDELLKEWWLKVDEHDESFTNGYERPPGAHTLTIYDYQAFADWLTLKLVEKRLLGEELCPTN